MNAKRGVQLNPLFPYTTLFRSGASVALVNGIAYFGTFENEVIALDTAARKVKWRYEHPDRKFPFYSSPAVIGATVLIRSEEHTSELQSLRHLVCRLLLEKKKKQ